MGLFRRRVAPQPAPPPVMPDLYTGGERYLRAARFLDHVATDRTYVYAVGALHQAAYDTAITREVDTCDLDDADALDLRLAADVLDRLAFGGMRSDLVAAMRKGEYEADPRSVLDDLRAGSKRLSEAADSLDRFGWRDTGERDETVRMARTLAPLLLGRFEDEHAILVETARRLDPGETIEPVAVKDVRSFGYAYLKRLARRRPVDPEALAYLAHLR